MRACLRVAVALWLLTGLARAQGVDPAAAELLFAQGRQAMTRGDYETACEKFAESQRLDPGAGTLINLAECLDKQGKLAESWQAWKEALRLLRAGDDRRWAVEHRIEDIEKRLPHLEIRLGDRVPPGAVVLRDGIELGRPALGLPLPVDPGRHVVVVRAEGHAERSYEVELAEAETEQLVVEAGPVVEETPEPRAVGTSPRKSPSEDAAPAESGGPTRETLGFIVGSVGVAAVGTGAVFGILALGKKGEMDDACETIDGETRCLGPGLEAADSGRTYATVANVGVALGLVGIGVGAYLLLTGDDDEAPRAAVSAQATRDGARLNLAGTF